MSPDDIARVLLEVGRRTAADSPAVHPIDIAIAISFAVESAGETLDALTTLGIQA